MDTRDRRLMLTAAALAVLPLAAVPAQVYRCQADGVVVFSDKPCAPGAQPVEVPKATVIPAQKGDDLLAEARKREARERQQADTRRKAEAEWQARYAQDKAEAERVQRGRAQGIVVEGMTPADVRRIHGEPTIVSRNQKGQADRETWSYLLDDARVTVVFSEGKVSSVKTREMRR